MKRAAPPPGYIEVRDPRTQKLVCHYHPRTGEVVVIQRGDVRRATLPRDRVSDSAPVPS